MSYYEDGRKLNEAVKDLMYDLHRIFLPPSLYLIKKLNKFLMNTKKVFDW